MSSVAKRVGGVVGVLLLAGCIRDVRMVDAARDAAVSGDASEESSLPDVFAGELVASDVSLGEIAVLDARNDAPQDTIEAAVLPDVPAAEVFQGYRFETTDRMELNVSRTNPVPFQPFTQPCSPNELVVGMVGRGGGTASDHDHNVHWLQWPCARLDATGMLFPRPPPVVRYGGGAANVPPADSNAAEFFDYCADGSVLVGMTGQLEDGGFGAHVNTLRVECAPLDAWTRPGLSGDGSSVVTALTV